MFSLLTFKQFEIFHALFVLSVFIRWIDIFFSYFQNLLTFCTAAAER